MLLIIDISQERKLAQRGDATFPGSHSWRSRARLRPRSGGLQGLGVHWGAQEGFMEEVAGMWL